MPTYTNQFNCMVNHDKTEVILTFCQRIPSVGPDGKTTSPEVEPVSTLVMTGNLARELQRILGDLLGQ